MAADRDDRRVRAAHRRRHAAVHAAAARLAADRAALGGPPGTALGAAAEHFTVFGGLRPAVLLAGAGVAGVHLAAHLGAAAFRRDRRRGAAAVGLAAAARRRDARRVLPPGDRRSAG